MTDQEFKELFYFGQLAEHPRVIEAGAKNPLVVHWGDRSVLVEWQPGNGSRYPVLFNYMPKDIGKQFGCGGEALLITVITPNRSYPTSFSRGDGSAVFHESYTSEKFCLDMDSDVCQAISAIVNCGLNCHSSSYGAECINRVMKHV